MRRTILTPAEKKAVLGSLTAWDSAAIKRTDLEALAGRIGISARDAYVTLLHIDTLHALGPEAPLVWKGGTAIQSLLAAGVQRVSTDLDFNSTTGNVEILRETITDVNDRLRAGGNIVEVKGVPFGLFYEADHRPDHQTLEFRRLLPTPFDEQVDLPRHALPGLDETVRVQGRLSRVQIAYGHHEMAALHPTRAEVRFFTQPSFEPRRPVTVTRGSVHDLAADKILATTRHDGFGRERFKDIYDLVALRHLGTADLEVVRTKLARIRGDGRVPLYVDGTLETLRILGLEAAAAQGFKGTVCSDGKAWVERWGEELEATIAWLAPMGSGIGR